MFLHETVSPQIGQFRNTIIYKLVGFVLLNCAQVRCAFHIRYICIYVCQKSVKTPFNTLFSHNEVVEKQVGKATVGRARHLDTLLSICNIRTKYVNTLMISDGEFCKTYYNKCGLLDLTHTDSRVKSKATRRDANVDVDVHVTA